MKARNRLVGGSLSRYFPLLLTAHCDSTDNPGDQQQTPPPVDTLSVNDASPKLFKTQADHRLR